LEPIILPADALGSLYCKTSNFRKNVRKVIHEVKWRCGANHKIYSQVKWNEVKRSEVKWSEVKWSEVKWSEVKWSVVKWNEMKCIYGTWSEIKWNGVS
jgi:hypothetical protein